MEGLSRVDRSGEVFKPSSEPEDRLRERKAWAQAVARARGLSIQ
jgi:hypothetical protein